MAKRYGVVLKFKHTLSRKQCEEVMQVLKDMNVLDDVYLPGPVMEKGPIVNEYDDASGGPIWYIP